MRPDLFFINFYCFGQRTFSSGHSRKGMFVNQESVELADRREVQPPIKQIIKKVYVK